LKTFTFFENESQALYAERRMLPHDDKRLFVVENWLIWVWTRDGVPTRCDMSHS